MKKNYSVSVGDLSKDLELALDGCFDGIMFSADNNLYVKFSNGQYFGIYIKELLKDAGV